jgi:hypothetical protein
MSAIEELTDEVRRVRERLATVAGRALAPASDDELCALTVAVEEAGRLLDALRVSTAGEIDDRSRYGLGSDGLAFRFGHRRGDQLVEQLTRVSPGEASRRVRVGRAIRPGTALDGTTLPPSHPVVSAAMADGSIGVDAAAVIVRCMDDARRTATDDLVLIAETALVETAAVSPADEVGVQARAWREALDPDGAEPRDERMLRKRSFHLGREKDGLVPFSGQLEPVGAALLKAAFAEADKRGATPRFLSEADERAGVTFVTGDTGETTIKLVDRRSREQRHYDVFTGLVKAGIRSTGTQPGEMKSTAAVTAVITLDDLRARSGVGWIEGIDEPISAASVMELVCSSGYAPLLLGDNGEILFYGRTRRLFSQAQLRAMAVRDGGCVNCGAPPGACEGHHVNEWVADEGLTDVDNGLLLCSGCHHMIHTNDFTLRMIGGRPHMLAPPWLDPSQTWRPLGNPRLKMIAALQQRLA